MMFDNQNTLKEYTSTVLEILKAESQETLFKVLSNSNVNCLNSTYDNWDGGTYYYTISLDIEVPLYITIKENIEAIETSLLEKFSIVTKHIENHFISKIQIIPKASSKIDWDKISGIASREQLIEDVKYLKFIMIQVATGLAQIQEVNEKYIVKSNIVNKCLEILNFKNPNQFKDLWEWFHKWKESFPTYNERRIYISELYKDIIKNIEESERENLVSVTVDLSDWERIQRSINEIKSTQSRAKTQEHFQTIGLLSRETIISLAQAVFIKETHPILDKTEVSKTDAKRMLEAYIAVALAGGSNEILRKYARATLDLANELTHKRSATLKESAICSTATISLVNLIGIIEGKI